MNVCGIKSIIVYYYNTNVYQFVCEQYVFVYDVLTNIATDVK